MEERVKQNKNEISFVKKTGDRIDQLAEDKEFNKTQEEKIQMFENIENGKSQTVEITEKP